MRVRRHTIRIGLLAILFALSLFLFGASTVCAADTLMMGTPELVEEKCRHLLEAARGDQRFILSSGCEVSMATPIENIQTMVTVRDAFEAQERS